DRASSLVLLRNGLLRGDLPLRELSCVRWPTSPELRIALLTSLEQSGIVPLCRGEPDLTDEVLATILDAVLGAERLCFSASAHFAGLALAEHQRRGAPCSSCCAPPDGGDDVCRLGGGGGVGSGGTGLDSSTLDAIRSEARTLAVEVATAKIRAEMAVLPARAVAITKLRELLACLAPRRGFTLARGALRAIAMKDVASVYQLVAHLEQLRDLV